jgi:NAD(P)-dependent dehydrogenase (short-subunit alcohol dehydrogenase family)
VQLRGAVEGVTGGGSGLGEPPAHRLGRVGARPAGVDLRVERAARVADELRRGGCDAATDPWLHVATRHGRTS